MATLSIDPEVSPRLITVAAPDTELTVQELLDWCRDWEDDPVNLTYPILITAAGKEPLGGGVLVGVTATLQNCKVQFEARPGPSYVECSLSGGNLVAVDDVGADTTPIEPSAFVFVVRTSSSSATLSDLEAIQYSSFNNGVTIDVTNGSSGTVYPTGTREHPVDNITDAKLIAAGRGFTRLYFVELASTIGATDDVSNYLVEGVYHDRSVLTLTTGCTITDVQFNNFAIQGDAVNDFCVLDNCSLRTIDNFNGNVYRSELGGTIKINLGSYRHWINCISNQNTGIPILDFQSITQNLILTGYSGDIKIRNMTGGSLELFCDSAYVEIESNCTGGTISLYGTGGLTDNSVGTTVVSDNYITVGGLTAAQDTIIDNIYAQLTSIEGTVDHKRLMRMFFSAMCCKLHGAGTTTITFRDMMDSKDRMVATVDETGNRESIVWNMD